MLWICDFDLFFLFFVYYLTDFADLKFDPKDVVTNELSTPVDENAIKDYLNDWSKEWSINVNKQDARAMADSYTDDAVYIEEGKAEASTKAGKRLRHLMFLES